MFPVTRHLFLSTLLVALITAFALMLAYQVRSRVVVDIGGKWDAPFVARFFDAEGDAAQTYRWTRTQSRIELEGQNLSTPWTMRVRLNGYRPNRPVNVQVQMNGARVDEFQARDGWEIYQLEGNVASDAWNGNNIVLISNDTFTPSQEIEGSTDSRKLGVATDWIELTPARSATFIGNDDAWLDFGSPPLMPPVGVLLSWASAFGLLYATARGISLPKRAVNFVVATLVALLAIGFAFARPFLAYYTTSFLLLALALAFLASLFYFLLPRFAAHLHLALDQQSRTLVCAIVLLSIALKWGGAWYPQFRSSDLLFHAHRLEFVSHGQLFFTSELPDAARRVVPYPPALYIALAPFTVFNHEYSALLIVLNVLADALAILAIYFAARQILQKVAPRSTLHAPLFSAFLFAFNPVSFWIYSWGNHTNIFGQDAATILFCILLSGWGTERTLFRSPRGGERYGERSVRAGNFLVMLFLFLLASVSHLGVFLSLLLFFPLTIAMRLLARDKDARRESIALLALFGAGIVLVSALYYAEFSEALLAQTSSFVGDFSSGRAAGRGGVTLARVGDVARYTFEQLGWVLLLAGVVGMPLAWENFAGRARAVWSAWLVVGIIFAIVTIGASFSTRYTLWVAPALALSGGLFLAWLFEKSRAARFAAYALCAFAFAQTLWVWVERVWNAYH